MATAALSFPTVSFGAAAPAAAPLPSFTAAATTTTAATAAAPTVAAVAASAAAPAVTFGTAAPALTFGALPATTTTSTTTAAAGATAATTATAAGAASTAQPYYHRFARFQWTSSASTAQAAAGAGTGAGTGAGAGASASSASSTAGAGAAAGAVGSVGGTLSLLGNSAAAERASRVHIVPLAVSTWLLRGLDPVTVLPSPARAPAAPGDAGDAGAYALADEHGAGATGMDMDGSDAAASRMSVSGALRTPAGARGQPHAGGTGTAARSPAFVAGSGAPLGGVLPRVHRVAPTPLPSPPRVPEWFSTVPSAEELAGMSLDDLSHVDGFTVTRRGFGSVQWLEPVDLRGVDLGEVVRIDLREVTVYPDDGDAAPRGTGLNKPALVALLQCCDVDSATGDVALAGAAKWRAACVTQCHRSGAMFVDYVAERGLWVFSVNHFSRYGFDDSDSDDDGAPAGQRPPPARGAAAQAGAAGAAGLRSALRPAGAAVQQGGATPAGARGARVEFAPSTKGGRARAGADDDDDGGDDDDDGAGPRMLVPRVSYSRSVQDVTGVDEGAYADDGDDAGAAGSSRFTGGASAVPSAGPLGSLPSASVADMFDGATADGVDGGADASTAPPYGMQLLLGRPPMTVADTAPLVGEVRSFVMEALFARDTRADERRTEDRVDALTRDLFGDGDGSEDDDDGDGEDADASGDSGSDFDERRVAAEDAVDADAALPRLIEGLDVRVPLSARPRGCNAAHVLLGAESVAGATQAVPIDDADAQALLVAAPSLRLSGTSLAASCSQHVVLRSGARAAPFGARRRHVAAVRGGVRALFAQVLRAATLTTGDPLELGRWTLSPSAELLRLGETDGGASAALTWHQRALLRLSVALFADDLQQQTHTRDAAYDALRRDKIGHWLAQTLREREDMQPTVGSGTPLPRAERLFHLALRNQIDDAVQLALASGLERVVPLLPHFACQRAVFAPLLRTVVDRIKQVKPGNADEELLPLYSLLAGLRAPEVTDRLRYEQSLWPPASVAAAGDDGDAAAEADEADGGERLDWLLVLAFVLWYSGDVDASFAASQSSVHDVLKAVLQDVQGDKRAGDRDTACRAIYGAADAEVTVRDSLLSLLQLYVQLGRQSADTGARVAALVEQVLDEDGQCRGRMAGALDAAVRWVLMRVLIDCGVVPTAVSALSQACSRVTVAATAQLVDAGLWQEALVVAMSHESERARRAAVQTVLERWVAHECRAADAAASTSASAAADAAAAEPRTTRPGRRAGVGASGMDGVAGFGHGAGSDGYDSLDEDAFDDRAAAAQAPAGGDEDEWIADDTSARGGRASAALAARRWTSVLSHCAGVHGVAVAWQCVVAIASCCAARGWRVLTTALWLASGIDGATLSAHLGVDATGRAHAAAGRTVPRGTASSSVRVLLTVVGEAVGAVGARLYASSSNAATSSAGASTFHVRRTFGIDAVPGVFAACVPFVREELLARHITDYVQTCFAGGLLAENVLPASARAGASAAVPSAARASLEPLWLQLLRVWDARNPAGLPGSLRPWLVLRTCVDVDVARAGAGAHRDVARIIQVLADLPSELSVAQRVCVDLLGRWLHQHVHPRDARPWQTAFASQATGSTAAPLYQQEALHAGLRRDLLHVAVDDLLAGLC